MIRINIGVDIGGNHTGIGIVDENGKIVKLQILDYENHKIEIDMIFDFINHFIAQNYEYEIKSIGIGIPGIVKGSEILYTCNIPIGKINIHDYIKSTVPIYLSNDVNCATIAEYEVIDHKFYSNYALIAVGTRNRCRHHHK